MESRSRKGLRGSQRYRGVRKGIMERIPARFRKGQRKIRSPKPILKMISPADIITLMNFLCGVFAVMSSVDGGDGLRKAMYLIGFGMIFDGLDGPVARRFGSSHRFGVWLDSMADAVTFCIAPAILVYNMFKDPTGGFFGSLQSFVVIITSVSIALLGILRLARFSIYSHRWKDFIGLPTPAMALIVVSFSSVFFWSGKLGIEVRYLTTGPLIILPVFFFLVSLAMVADLRYRKYRGRIMALQGFIVILLILCLFLGIEHPVMGLTGGISVSLAALMYLLTPLSDWSEGIWGASRRAEPVEESPDILLDDMENEDNGEEVF